MDDKKREILERNRILLVENIILTEEFYQLLRTEAILPETMIKDVKSCKTAYERNSMLLDRLQLRAGNAYRKFRHVLYLTGHRFLTDHLYTEECDTKVLRADDLFAKFPNIFNHVSDDAKAKLLRYLETKVKEKALINDWIKTGPERTELLEAKKTSFNAEKELTNRLDDKSKRIIHLEDENDQLKEEVKKQRKDINELHKEVADTKRCLKNDLAKQSRFNAANNNSIIQLSDRFNSFNERVKVLNIYIRTFLDAEDAAEIEDDQDNIKISVLEKNVKKLTQVARTNMETSSSNVNEKEQVLSILQTSANHKEDSLSDIVQHYVKKEEKGKHALSKEFEGILELLRGNKFTARILAKPRMDMKWLRSQAAVIREEVEHLKKKLEWKDNQITELLKEAMAIKNTKQQSQQLTPFSLPKLSGHTHPDSPDSLKEMDKVYQQIDRYTNDPSVKPTQRRMRKRRGSLADVNLEPTSPDGTEVNAQTRRNPRLDTSDLNKLRNSDSSREVRAPSLQDACVTETTETKDSEFTGHADGINKNKEFQKRRNSRPEYVPSFRQEGRRPSLAELVTIYEKSHEIKMPDSELIAEQ